MNLDRAGIFKARPLSWRIKVFEGKQSVAIAIEFLITAQLNGGEWSDWSGYEENHVSGDFWVIGKTGQPNVDNVKRLRDSLGWRGVLNDVVSQDVPDIVVQITVNPEEYNGKTHFRAAWINPEDFTPSKGASADEVKQLDARFGSLLRAAAGAPSGKPQPPKSTPAVKPKPEEPYVRQDPRDATPEADHYETIPF